jgi:hypothetical protein
LSHHSLTRVALGIRRLQLQRPHLTLSRSHCTRTLRGDAAAGEERVRRGGAIGEIHNNESQRIPPCPGVVCGTIERDSQLPQLLREFC